MAYFLPYSSCRSHIGTPNDFQKEKLNLTRTRKKEFLAYFIYIQTI